MTKLCFRAGCALRDIIVNLIAGVGVIATWLAMRFLDVAIWAQDRAFRRSMRVIDVPPERRADTLPGPRQGAR